MPADSVREVVMELAGGVTLPGDMCHESVAAALLRLPGVVEAHVDAHQTWAMVTFDPDLTTTAVIAGVLGDEGLAASRVRVLVPDSDACE